LNWSGGKDSALSLYHCLKDDKTDVKLLLTTLSEKFGRVSMHGVRRELLQLQAGNLGVELKEIFLPENTSIGIYDLLMKKNLTELKTDGIDYSVFGDIFLEDLREYREKRLAEIPMAALFPLWGRSTSEIMNEFISLGFKAVVTCVNEKYLDKSFLGRYLDNAFLNDLPNNVDPCGENGEFHTFVFDGPLFRKPVEFEFGEIVYKNYKPVSDSKDDECYSENVQSNFDTGFWYMDLLGKLNEE
jgi:uncharacterized protein (TIGR00290 family)